MAEPEHAGVERPVPSPADRPGRPPPEPVAPHPVDVHADPCSMDGTWGHRRPLRRPEPGPARGGHACRRGRCSWSPARARARPGCSPTASRTSSPSSGVSPFEMLAITFTNKAAGEMKERVARARRPGRAAACGCRRSTPRARASCAARRTLLGYRPSFTIYDQADAVRLTDWVRRDLNLDPKRFPPRRSHAQISRAEERARPARRATREMAVGPPRRRIAEVYTEYQRRLQRGVGGRLRRPARARRAPVPRAPRRRSQRWRAALPATCSSTSSRTRTLAQWELVRLLTEEHRSVMVVGDADQCLVAGTHGHDGRRHRRSRSSRCVAGDEVLSCYGSGDFRAVARAARRTRSQTSERRRDHARERPQAREHARAHALRRLRARAHSATPHDLPDVEGRRRLPRRHVAHVHRGQSKAVFGPAQRCHQERGDAVWVVGTHDTDAEARLHEALYSRALRDCPRCRSWHARRLVRPRAWWEPTASGSALRRTRHRQARPRADSRMKGSASIIRITRLEPLRQASAHAGDSMWSSGGDRRGAAPMHRISLFGYD